MRPRTSKTRICLAASTLISVAAALASSVVAQSTAEPPPSVGMPRTLNALVLPGTELEVTPLEDHRAPLVVRIVRSTRHGDAWRYDLSWYALEAGDYDLRTALRRKDGNSTAELPPLPVKVVSTLSNKFTLPHELTPDRVSGFGNYRIWGGVVLALWGLGFFAIMQLGRRRKSTAAAQQVKEPATIAERLRPLVKRGIEGTITPAECAILERCLLQYWTERLGLEEQSPAERFRQLREHPEAKPLIQQLEVWLHQPATDVRESMSKPC